jgi:hypothetical protein
VERVQLTWQVPKVPVQTWHYGRPRAGTIRLGQLVADGRWYAERTGALASEADLREGARVFSADEQGQRAALAAVHEWMALTEGGWEAV